MAIVKMRRLRLMAMQPEREELLKVLQRLGCVEIRQPEADPDDPQWAGLSHPDGAALNEARDTGASVNAALASLQKYAPAKRGLLQARPTVAEGTFFDDSAYASALELAHTIDHAQRRILALQGEQAKLRAQKAALVPWLPLDVPLDASSTGEAVVQFGSVPARMSLDQLIAALADATPLAQLIHASSDTDAHYLLFVCHRSAAQEANAVLKEFGFSTAVLKGLKGTAAENDRALDAELERIAAQLTAEEEAIAACAARREELERCADRAAQEIGRQEARSRLMDTDAAFWLEGWLPAASVDELAEVLAPFTCAWETADPTEEEYPEVPIKLKNGAFSRCMDTVTEMYSLPSYDGVDPNPLMAPFFILFFGVMMADMGYGLLMIAASAVYLKKTKPKKPAFMEMIFWCGISTFLVGALTGGFFGDFIPQLLTVLDPSSTFEMPALLSPLDDIVTIMIGSLILGVIQIFTGMGISVYRKVKAGDFIDALFSEITWWIILGGLALWICGMMLPGLPAILGTAGQAVLIAGALMLVFGGTRSAKGFGKVTALVGIVYNGVTGYFSDILSYIRLMALMVSGSVIASVFNTLGATFGNLPLFILISLLGNALNLALNLLGCYVHDLRLQCLEFFGRFYSEGGRPFQPLTIQTKYVDIIKEEH